MKWSMRLGTLAGIGVYVHATFLLILLWVGFLHYAQDHTLVQAFHGLLFVLVIFGVVVLHELGHALTARKFGIQTKDIILFPIGGVARLERMPEDPVQEFLVAVAGPAVNVVLAGALFGIVWPIWGGAAFLEVAALGQGNILVNLFWVNIFLAVFNMLPAFPMDGGRVLRALLATRLEYVQATQIAATIGQGMAIFLGFVGLFMNPLLIFIALFVWMGASSESSMVQMKSALGGIPLTRAMITDFQTLHPGDPLQRAVDHVIAGFQHDFPVVDDDGQVVGVLLRGNLFKALSEQGENAPVREAMHTEFETADPSEMLENAFMRLQNCDCYTVPVLRGGKLVGLLTMENLGEFMMVQSALREARPRLFRS